MTLLKSCVLHFNYRAALGLIEDIKRIIENLCQEQAIAPINVELVDNEVAMIYENSSKGKVIMTFITGLKIITTFVWLKPWV
jgi:hypothetical protein